MKKIKTLEDAFIHELSDMYNAEKQLTKALPKMAKACSDAKLAEAFEYHLKETEEQLDLLDQAIEVCNFKIKNEKCDAMQGLIKEGDEIIKEVDTGPVRDALLITAAQKVEHYEISGYGSLIALAKKLGFIESIHFLERILDQEKVTDKKLNMLAEQVINEKALQAA